jgi:excisionase family DNA binding protein
METLVEVGEPMPKKLAGVVLYTLDEIAERLHVSERTLYRYVLGNRLKAQKIGNNWYVTEANLAAFLNSDYKGGAKTK